MDFILANANVVQQLCIVTSSIVIIMILRYHKYAQTYTHMCSLFFDFPLHFTLHFTFILLFNFFYFTLCIGLTDKVLESVVAKGSGEMLSLDLSAVPHLLTDHALSIIGQC